MPNADHFALVSLGQRRRASCRATFCFSSESLDSLRSPSIGSSTYYRIRSRLLKEELDRDGVVKRDVISVLTTRLNVEQVPKEWVEMCHEATLRDPLFEDAKTELEYLISEGYEAASFAKYMSRPLVRVSLTFGKLSSQELGNHLRVDRASLPCL